MSDKKNSIYLCMCSTCHRPVWMSTHKYNQNRMDLVNTVLKAQNIDS